MAASRRVGSGGTNWRTVARRYARRHGLNPTLFERQIGEESNFNPNARSPAGATGIAQIMPGTARGWGVNPNDPRASLNAAARAMAQYVRQYGSYRNALVAYNAGPGRVGKPLYDETRNYINKILGGGQGQTQVGPGESVGVPDAPPPEDSGSDLMAVIQQLNEAAAPLRDDGGSVLDSFGGPDPLQDPAGSNMALFQRLINRRSASEPDPEATSFDVPEGDGGSGRGGGLGNNLKIFEMFYDPGINLDNGQRTKAIGGHGGHVHVAAPRDVLMRIARYAQRMGLRVGEFEPFDRVDPVHTQGSFHYRQRAADISGDPAKLRRLNRLIARLAR